MAKPWNKGLTATDPRVALAEAKRRASRAYISPDDESGPRARDARYRKRQRQRDPLGLLARERRSRNQAKHSGIYCETVDYRLVLNRTGWVCGICGGIILADYTYSRSPDLSFDHIKPFCEGGEHIAENIQPCHAACNSRKGEAESRDARLEAIRKRGQ